MRQTCATTVICLAFLAAGGVGADVLVTTDGTVVETKGPWQQRGKMVVFTLENGSLSALRAEDVDFEATEKWRSELAEGAKAAVAPSRPAPAKARLVLTDADVARAPVLEPQETDVSAPGPNAPAQPATPADPDVDPATQTSVRVTAWDQDEPADGRGRRVFGTLRNDGNSLATDISVEVSVYDDDGAIAGTQTVQPLTTSLRPGESANFTVQFTEVYVIGVVRFRISSLDLELGGGIEEDAPG